LKTVIAGAAPEVRNKRYECHALPHVSAPRSFTRARRTGAPGARVPLCAARRACAQGSTNRLRAIPANTTASALLHQDLSCTQSRLAEANTARRLKTTTLGVPVEPEVSMSEKGPSDRLRVRRSEALSQDPAEAELSAGSVLAPRLARSASPARCSAKKRRTGGRSA